jgi:hypothetical protein
MRAFNTRAARDTWGGWSVAHAMLPEEAMATAPESLTWEHPERSSFSVVLAGVEYEAILTKSHRFIADKYSSQHQHWRDGARVTDTEPSASTRSSVVDCYYTGRLRELSPNPNTNTNTNTNTVSASPTRVHVSQANPAKAAVIAGSRVVVHTCRGGFEGTLHLDGHIYAISPAMNHLSAQTLVKDMVSLEQAAIHVPIGSLHIVYDLSNDFDTTGLAGCNVGDHGSEQGPDAIVQGFAAGGSLVHDHMHAHAHAHTHGDLLSASTTTSSTAFTPSPSNTTSTSTSTSTPRVRTSASAPLYVEWLLVSDKRRYDAYGTDLETDTISLAHAVASYYDFHSRDATGSLRFSKSISVVLVSHVAFTIEDPWTVSTGTCATCTSGEVSSSELLSRWCAWRNSAAAPENDNGHLLSGHNFDGSVLGLAYLGTQCTPSACGIDQTTISYSNAFNSIVIAHELGHNGNMLVSQLHLSSS